MIIQSFLLTIFILISGPLVLPTSADALTTTIYVENQPVTLLLPDHEHFVVYEEHRDYDVDILRASIDLLNRCARAAQDPARPVVAVDDWAAVMGLSTRLSEFAFAVNSARVLKQSPLDNAWYRDYLADLRAKIIPGRSAFVMTFYRRHFYELRSGIDWPTLARRSIANLRCDREVELTRWMQRRVRYLPPHALRPPLRGVAAVPPAPVRTCADTLQDNVVPFPSKPK